MSSTTETKRIPFLPSDIIHAIVDIVALDFDTENLDLDVQHERRLQREYQSKDLLSLRAVCREFCWIASPRAFRTLRLTYTLKSIAGFLEIMRSPWIKHGVQSVKYQYWNPGQYCVPLFSFPVSDIYVAAVAADYHRYEKPSDDDASERENSAEIRPQLSRALSRLHEFPALRSLSIRFGENSPRVTNLDRIRDDLSSILDALVSLSPSLTRPLESLSLSRLPPIHLEQYDSPAFLALRANLSLFDVNLAGTEAWSELVTPPLPQGMLSPCEPFFQSTIPGRFLPQPSAATGLANLEALALCFSDHVGVFYFAHKFGELRFPRLRALRLQHVQFSVAGDAENFVSRHAETLLELHLLHCQVAVAFYDEEADADTPGNVGSGSNPWPPPVPRPWSRIYKELTTKLERLVFLDVQDPWWISFPDRYVAYSPLEIMQILEGGVEDDRIALEEFRNTVKGRANQSPAEYERELFSVRLIADTDGNLASFPIRDKEELICDCH
jgi:hypothetical protein